MLLDLCRYPKQTIREVVLYPVSRIIRSLVEQTTTSFAYTRDVIHCGTKSLSPIHKVDIRYNIRTYKDQTAPIPTSSSKYLAIPITSTPKHRRRSV